MSPRRSPAAIPQPPVCAGCGFVMCEQFDERRLNAVATLATPNGKYSCCSGRCAPALDERGAR